MSGPAARAARFLDPATPPTLGTLIAVTGVAAMSMNIFLPSLPRIAEDLDAGYGAVQLSVALYLASTAVMQVFLGPLADRYGRRPVLLGAFALYIAASLVCALAESLAVFLGARMVQAAVYSGVILARAIVRDLAGPDEAAARIGAVTMGMALVPMVSPALGGLLEDLLGWRASFWLMTVLGALAMALIWRDLGETGPRAYASLGAQLRGYPELLAAPRFWAYSLAAACAAGTFFAYLGGAPFLGSHVFGLAPVELGLLFGSTSLGYVCGSFLSTRLSARHGVLRMTLAGSLTTTLAIALSLALFLLGLGSAYSFFGLTVIVGVGYGMTLPNATSGALSVRPHLAGTASGLGGALMIGGGAALSAFAGAVMVPGAGAERLLLIQGAASLTGVVATLFIARREGLRR
ncbi:multidrug effflux MFS transporter [Roseivivax sp. GX 12232]|uniref:multidrug effflux MFS transporter n=1 Tax=Roseivivax sp. GX 12232 TaxID=2900547 RepID=UPI001E64F13E|nr:multidrug effflux MFS transporter [Roseivivax sp. GX 12232]MCE0507239.1 multidrug effflux MFS transporter [Roseivivax sp. GX 12232]